MERRRAILFCVLYEVPVNRKENDGIKLNGIIIAINQASDNGGSSHSTMRKTDERGVESRRANMDAPN